MGRLQPGNPQRIGPYRLIRELGSGGMGRVFLARSAGGRPVAVKVIRPELAADPKFLARFRHEVAAARKVNGLYTALVVDADIEGPMPWLATAYVAGPSLADKVDLEGPLPAGAVAVLAAGLAEGLDAIHAAGLVHRDLKPSNVLLADDGPRVIDFGISRAAEASSLTSTGWVVGTPGYMSPEQADGLDVGPPSDVFSLGAVLTFASTGHGPFGTGSAPALGYRVVHAEPDLAGIPAEIRPLVRRCLAKDPAERPPITELLAEFGDPDVPQDWLSPAHPREPAPDAPANAPHVADAAPDDAPAPAPVWTPTLQNQPHPAPELPEGRIAAAPSAADAAEDDAPAPAPVPTPAPRNRPDPALEVTESMITPARPDTPSRRYRPRRRRHSRTGRRTVQPPPLPATPAVASRVWAHVISIVGSVFVARAAGGLIVLFGFFLIVNSIARSSLGYHAFSGIVYIIAGLVLGVLGYLILAIFG